MASLGDRIHHHLAVLVDDIGARPPGSPANRRATDHVRTALASAGHQVAEHPFTTRWWEPGDGCLEVAGRRFEVVPNPFSPAGDVEGRAVLVSDIDELEGLAPAEDTIVVLTGDLASEQVLPAVFPFLDLPEHARIRTALARLGPAAVVAVSDHWQPILEDPDLTFPSTTIPTTLGREVPAGAWLHLTVSGAVHHGDGVNLSTRLGVDDPRVVLCAHLDTKSTTPGAFDNAASIAVLLALVELGHLDEMAVELVLFNGEDHVDACGEMAWLAATDLSSIHGAINLDGVGLTGQRTSLATLACPDALEARLAGWLDQRPGWVPVEPWYESDHAIFALRGIPAVAITSEDVHALLGGLAHTPADTLEVLDTATLQRLAHELPGLIDVVASELC